MKTQIERAEPSRGAPNAAHTPGPWDHTNDIPLSVWANGVWIATTNVETIRDFAEKAANARLIAQAPTLLAENEKLRAGHVVLLEALRMAHRYFLQSNKLTVDDREMLDEMWAAIKQAERT